MLWYQEQCVLTDHLSHFHVSTGYPPDIVHDLFEGDVPVELARCIRFPKNNKLILTFPYKRGDKTNCPHLILRLFKTSNTIGGNAHGNWALLRFLPLLIGHILPEGEPAWQVIIDLKNMDDKGDCCLRPECMITDTYIIFNTFHTSSSYQNITI